MKIPIYRSLDIPVTVSDTVTGMRQIPPLPHFDAQKYRKKYFCLQSVDLTYIDSGSLHNADLAFSQLSGYQTVFSLRIDSRGFALQGPPEPL